MILSKKQMTKVLISLRISADWSAPVLFALTPKTGFLVSWGEISSYCLFIRVTMVTDCTHCNYSCIVCLIVSKLIRYVGSMLECAFSVSERTKWLECFCSMFDGNVLGISQRGNYKFIFLVLFENINEGWKKKHLNEIFQ